MNRIDTTLSAAGRARLAAEPGIGAGNFLAYAARINPAADHPILYLEKPWTTFRGETYAELSLDALLKVAGHYAAWYHGAGVRAKDVVAVYLDDGAAYLGHYLALTSLGAIPALINGNMPGRIAAAHARRVGAVGVFADRRRLEPFTGPESSFKFLVTDEDLAVAGWGPGGSSLLPPLPPDYPYVHDGEDPIMIAHSSGTTGIPKPVLLQHRGFFHGVRYRLAQGGVTAGDRLLSSLPHSHNCAIAYIMLALLNGTPVLILSDHTGPGVLKHIRDWRPTTVVTFPQTFVELTENAPETYDLSSVQLWMNGGDAAHEPHIRRLLALAPGSRFIDGMGSSEMGFSLFRHLHTATSNHYRRCVGKPHDWVEAAVLGDDGAVLPHGQVGRLGVKAPSVTSGYWNDSVLTHKTRLSGFWLTGDLAYRDADGFFYHVDRVPDVVRTAVGPLYSLQTEELLLATFPEISDVAVVAALAGRPIAEGGELPVALVRLTPEARAAEPRMTAAELEERVNGLLATLGRPRLARLVFASSARVPLGSTGKVLKRELRERLAEPRSLEVAHV